MQIEVSSMSKAYFPLSENLSSERWQDLVRQPHMISTQTRICRAKIDGAKFCRIQYVFRMSKFAVEKGFATILSCEDDCREEN